MRRQGWVMVTSRSDAAGQGARDVAVLIPEQAGARTRPFQDAMNPDQYLLNI